MIDSNSISAALYKAYFSTNTTVELGRNIVIMLSQQLATTATLTLQWKGNISFTISSNRGEEYSVRSTIPLEESGIEGECWGNGSFVGALAVESTDNDTVKTLVELVSAVIDRRIADEDANFRSTATVCTRIMGILYHDVRNTLGSISGVAQLIQLDAEDNEELQDNCAGIVDVISRFDVTSKSTMKFYRDEALTYDNESFSGSELFNRILKKNKRVYSISDIILDYSVVEDLEIVGDKAQIEYIISELLANSYDSTEKVAQGKIAATITREGDFCCITIEDNGAGIAYDVQRFITNLFFTTKDKRYGVGLSRIIRYLKDWGGALSFVSTPNEGSSFSVKIPVSV